MKKSPRFIYTTRHGTYYHLTPTNLNTLTIDTALISAGDFVHLTKILQKLEANKLTFRKYINQEDKMLYLTPIDSYKIKCLEGMMAADSVKVQQVGGLKPYNVDDYNKLAELIQPEILVALTELPEVDAGLKSYKRSLSKSAAFLKSSLEHFKDNPNMKIFGAIQGGLQEDIREMAAKELRFATKYSNFAGLVFYGFGPADPWPEKDAAIEAVFKEYKEHDIEYVLAGKGDILSILWGISWGIDNFEIEEPFQLAENLKVMLLPNLDASNAELEIFQNDRLNFFEFESCKFKYLQFPIEKHIRNHIRIDPNCECFTCTHHTKLYISHLVECKEMNAQILLSIHNTFTYQRLQSKLQEMQSANRLNQWIRWFLSKI